MRPALLLTNLLAAVLSVSALPTTTPSNTESALKAYYTTALTNRNALLAHPSTANALSTANAKLLIARKALVSSSTISLASKLPYLTLWLVDAQQGIYRAIDAAFDTEQPFLSDFAAAYSALDGATRELGAVPPVGSAQYAELLAKAQHDVAAAKKSVATLKGK
ncbi:MAG: hypothetical protein M1829_003179 [Trizodia sp. TS-e1964]|nr:MAG: hypothetical protein M1829_003179 [Trizodia sp. TS-e1964]